MDNLEIPLDELRTKIVNTYGAGENEIIRSLSHDSRMVKQGDWFICLKGEASDGHDYIASALEKGAAGIICEPGRCAFKSTKIIETKDTALFLGELAAFHRERINPQVIAITGSNGKTSSKEIIAFLLGAAYPGKVFFSRGNWNNHFGLPFSLLQLTPDHRFAVVELGTNHPGEISYLSKIAKPNFAAVTSVAPGHIGNFGSLESIAEEKSCIADGMSGGYIALPPNLNGRRFFEEKALAKKIRVITPGNDVLKKSSKEFGTLFEYGGREYVLPIAGDHQFENFRLAVALLKDSGLIIDGFSEIFSRLENLKNVSGRLAKKEHPLFQVWDDSYNANPASFYAAMDFLSNLKSEHKKFGAFGMMGELGEFTEKLHEELAEYAVEKGFDAVFFFGVKEDACQGFRKGWTKRATAENLYMVSSDEMFMQGVDFLKTKMKPGDHLLVKGSRATKMERVFEYL